MLFFNRTPVKHDKERRDESRTTITPTVTRVSGAMNDIPTQLLVDTGSVIITVMSQTLHEQLERKLELVQQNIISATDHTVVAFGSLSVTVSIGPTKCHKHAIACKLVTFDFIVGVDFLNKHDFDIKIFNTPWILF